MKWGILKNEFDDNYLNWEISCKKYKQEYEVIDLVKNDFLESINNDFDGFLTCPSGRETLFKQLYDERIYIINEVLNKFCYPSYNEIKIHENKKFLAYWLTANNIPHPKTYVFYRKEEALKFVNDNRLPLVAKFNIGASGKGVKIFREQKNLEDYIEKVFSKGIRQSWGPNLKMGGWKNRIQKIIQNPSRIQNRLTTYKKVYDEIQKGFVIIQEYIPHEYEWRIVKIGDSYFGHQKVKTGDKASGTKGIDYVLPTNKHLDFIRNLCSQHEFNCMAVDAFEDDNGGLLVNELQTIFGHVQSYICEKDAKPGRLIFKDSKWIFEEGMFNTNLSYDIRLEHAISLIENKK